MEVVVGWNRASVGDTFRYHIVMIVDVASFNIVEFPKFVYG